MSDESSPQQEPRLKLNSQPDKVPAPSPPAQPPPPPAAPAIPVSPATTPDKPPQKLRISIAPFEPPKPPPPIPVSRPLMPVAPPTAAAGSVSAETPGTAPEKVIVMARVAIKPTESEPPADEDQTEAGHKLKLKSKEPLPWPTSPPAPVSGARAPAETNAIRRPPAPAISAPAPVVELPPLLSSVARKKPPRFEVDPVAIVLSLVGLLVFAGVVYLTYRKYVIGSAWHPRGPETAPEAAMAINPSVTPVPSAATRVPPALAPAVPRPAPPPALTARSARFHFFIDKLKVSGIRSGPPPRLFIEGLTYKPGDVVDQRLGIVFVGLDVTRKEIVFKDDTGTMVRRRY